MDIGTAKPSAADRAAVPHYLLDVVNPNERFTAADFKLWASRLVADIGERGKLPIIVGGTGLYVDSFLFNYQFGADVDLEQRTKLQAMNVEELQEICSKNGIEMPQNAKNKRHLVRAIELGGVMNQPKVLRPNTLVVGVSLSRDELHSRIQERAHSMFNDGIVAEVKRLAEKYGWDNEAMTANIYSVLKGVIEGSKSEAEALDEFVRSDMSLAKRQLTWFKRNPHIIWGTASELNKEISAFLAPPISS